MTSRRAAAMAGGLGLTPYVGTVPWDLAPSSCGSDVPTEGEVASCPSWYSAENQRGMFTHLLLYFGKEAAGIACYLFFIESYRIIFSSCCPFLLFLKAFFVQLPNTSFASEKD